MKVATLFTLLCIGMFCVNAKEKVTTWGKVFGSKLGVMNVLAKAIIFRPQNQTFNFPLVSQ